jgi:hypothetical protein
VITQKPLQTNARRQKAYRERKKQKRFYVNNYLYRRTLRLSADLDNKDDIIALIDECYEVGGERLVVRICCFINEFLSTHRTLPALAGEGG